MTSIESICNQALDLIGYKRHIGNIYEGTVQARALLDLWGQTRDEVLQRMAPDWAKQDEPLTLVKSAPNIQGGFANYQVPWTDAFPPLPWLYEYIYPSVCVQPLQIKRGDIFIPSFRPRSWPFRLNNGSDSTRTLLTNAPNAILIYVSYMPDPTLWQTDFIDAVVLTLAKKLQPLLAPHMEVHKNADNAS